jgi:hypothetical protein
MTPEERRKTLADFLEFEVQPRLDGAKFDMTTWGDSDDPLPPRSTRIERLSDCGFAGCAAGWGFFCPALRAEGIPVRIRYDNSLRSSFDELGEFFGTDPRKIFDNWQYPSPRSVSIPEVVKRLRATLTPAAQTNTIANQQTGGKNMPSTETLSDAAVTLLREIRDRGKSTPIGGRGRALAKLRRLGHVEEGALKITVTGREHLRGLKRRPS